MDRRTNGAASMRRAPDRDSRARAAQPNRRSAPSAPRRKAPRRRRAKINPVLLLILLGLFCLGIYIAATWFTTLINNSTYCDNVYINGIPITSYSKENGEAYILQRFDETLNTPFTLTGAGRSYSFTPADFNAELNLNDTMERAWNFGHTGNIFDRVKDIRFLKSNPVNLVIPVEYDESLVNSFIEQMYEELYIAPVDAVVMMDMESPTLISDSANGQELDREETKNLIVNLMEEITTDTSLPVRTLMPAFTSDMASSGLEVIVNFETDVSFRDYNSRLNVRKALSYFNGLCVRPGEVINFNDVVGERNEERGWQEATEYAGSTTSKGYGGGVCQASSTLYNAIIRAGMDVMERWPHSMTVTYVEPSLDAAVTNDTKNFIFVNNTDAPIYIYTEVTRTTASVKVFGKKPEYRYDVISIITQQSTAAVKVGYIKDEEGKYAYYVDDPPVLYKSGKSACESQSWLVAYDWTTGEEAWRKQLTNDSYNSGTDIYWAGIHEHDGSITPAAMT